MLLKIACKKKLMILYYFFTHKKTEPGAERTAQACAKPAKTRLKIWFKN
jgi:hypothetical protein